MKIMKLSREFLPDLTLKDALVGLYASPTALPSLDGPLIIAVGDPGLGGELSDAADLLTLLGAKTSCADAGNGDGSGGLKFSSHKALSFLSLLALRLARGTYPGRPPRLLQEMISGWHGAATKDNAATSYAAVKTLSLFLVFAEGSHTAADLMTLGALKKGRPLAEPLTRMTSAKSTTSPGIKEDRLLIIQLAPETINQVMLRSFLTRGKGGGFGLSPLKSTELAVKAARRVKPGEAFELAVLMPEGVGTEHFISTLVLREVINRYVHYTGGHQKAVPSAGEARFSEWRRNGDLWSRLDEPELVLRKTPPMAARVFKA